jgi:coenzyme F420-0:L-glutamate ligase / coenzyme F420-1:gamma-L-glutamate ligase
LAQKIVSKAEGRAVRLSMVTPSRRARDLAKQSEKDARVIELILQESTEVLRCRPGVLIVVHRLGFVIANAGIDASNVEGGERRETVLLLPTNPNASAASLRCAFAKAGTRMASRWESQGSVFMQDRRSSAISVVVASSTIQPMATP